MIKKLAFLALLISLTTATFWFKKPSRQPPQPPVGQPPNANCWFD